jgi:putative phage-type endonuclease
MSLTPAQVAERRSAMTATDLAALSGQHPHRSPVNVWEEKVGLAPPFAGNDRTKWGELLEPVVRSDYADRIGAHIEVHGTLTHPKVPRHKATPDGLVYVGAAPDPDRGLEVKCHTVHERWRYGEPGTDEVPVYEFYQCAWNMYVAGLPRWDLVLFSDNQPTDYVIMRDLELEAGMVEMADRFWQDHVVTKIPPQPDGSDAFGDYVARLFKKHRVDMVDADQETVERLRAARAALNAAITEWKGAAQATKLLIGEHAGMEWREGSEARAITWKLAQAGRATAWKDAAEWLQKTAQLGAMAAVPQLRMLHRVLSSWDPEAKVYGHDCKDGIMPAGASAVALAHAIDTIELLASPGAFDRFSTTKAESRRFCVPKDWPSISLD